MANRTSTSALRERIAVYNPIETETPGYEIDFAAGAPRYIWANVTPASGRTAALPGDMERAEVTHSVVARAAALPDLSMSMYFKARGQRLDVLYWYPVYNRRGWVEVFCRLVVEDG